MHLATSRFGAREAIRASGLAPVAISLGLPKWAPAGWMLRMERDQYERCYRRQLDKLGVVLLCWEDLRKEDQWCHRRMLAAWWQAQTGEEIPELPEPPLQPARPRPQQMALFP